MKHRSYLEGFPERLQQAIYNSNIDCKELGRRIVYERKSIYAWYWGDSCPNVVALARMYKVLNVSADYLLFGKE